MLNQEFFRIVEHKMKVIFTIASIEKSTVIDAEAGTKILHCQMCEISPAVADILWFFPVSTRQ
jgi:hypothetical protein